MTNIYDYETRRRQRRLSNSQSYDYLVVAGWIATACIVSLWARVLWIVGKSAYKAVIQ